jgi:hypothetical protein
MVTIDKPEKWSQKREAGLVKMFNSRKHTIVLQDVSSKTKNFDQNTISIILSIYR